MKRLTTLLCAVVAVLSFTACAHSKKESTMNTNTQKKILVAYFSATGTTQRVATKLAKTMNADLHEIKPATSYTTADLDWHDANSRSSVEMKDSTSRPAITDKLESMADYDVVFIGFPIWWYTAPTIINTFIESYNLNGKTLIPFATSGGSTIDKACNDLKKTYPQLNWQPGRLLNGASDAELSEWKETLGL